MKTRYHVILLISGLVIFALGLILYLLLPVIVRKKVETMLPLKNGGVIYDQWKNTTIPAYIQFWFFDISNPLEIVNGLKPALRQIGPYTYREYRIKYNITFHKNESVSYLQKRLYYFDREKSVGDENDFLTTVNMPLVVIGDKLNSWPKLIKEGISGIVSHYEKNGIFFKTSVKNLTWGYVDPMLEAAAYWLKKFHQPVDFDVSVGLFHGKNDTNDKMYLVDSGGINLDNFLNIYNWNGSDMLTMWNSPSANMINGTDGCMFAPFLNTSSTIYTFQSDICRSLYAEYTGSSEIKGIPSYQFEAPTRFFANSSVNPDNAGFCLDGYCLGAGLLNLSKCIPTAPIVMSQPHFYLAAPEYTDSVIGLNPSPEFTTSLVLEPTTGLPVSLQKKLQINIAMKPIDGFVDMSKIPTVIMPMMWLNESALIDDELADTLRHQLVLPVTIGHWLAIGLMIVGAVIVVIIVSINVKRRCCKSVPYKVINDAKTSDEI